MSLIVELHHIYVSEGDATAIVVRDGATLDVLAKALVDSGKGGINSNLIGYCKEAISEDLKFDYIITSHYHEDHYGYFYKGSGITYNKIISFGIGDLKVSEVSEVSDRKLKIEGYYSAFEDESKRVLVNITESDKPFPKIILYDGVELKFYASFGYAITNTNNINVLKLKDRPSIDPNSCSLVFTLTYQDFTYYSGGDITGGEGKDMETYLKDIIPGKVSVMKASHHGSTNSNNSAILEKLDPEAIVNFTYKTFTLPSEDYLKRVNSLLAGTKRLKGYYLVNDFFVNKSLGGVNKEIFNVFDSMIRKGVDTNLDNITTDFEDDTYQNTSSSCVVRYPITDRIVPDSSTKTEINNFEIIINKDFVRSTNSKKKPRLDAPMSAPPEILTADFIEIKDRITKKNADFLDDYYSQLVLFDKDTGYMKLKEGISGHEHQLILNILSEAKYRFKNYKLLKDRVIPYKL